MIQVKGLDDAVKALKRVERKTQYATAEAINKTALDLQEHTIGRILPDAFTLRKGRGNPWQKPKTKYGINLKPFANVRRQGKDLHAIVGSQADWLAEQEQGGTKRRSTSLAVPTDLLKKHEDVVVKRLKPKALIKKIRTKKFLTIQGQRVYPLTRKVGGEYEPIIKFENSPSLPGIWVRTKSGKIRQLYRFLPTADIINRVQYRKKSLKRVNQTWLRHFNNAMQAEFVSNKPKI